MIPITSLQRMTILAMALVVATAGAQSTGVPISVVPGIDYAEDFESGSGGWTASTLWTLDTPAQAHVTGAASGSQAWVTNPTGNYPHGVDASVTSPEFDFSLLVVDPTIRLKVSYLTEFFYDGFRVELDVGGGFIPVGGVELGWYDASLSPLALGGQGFTGSSGSLGGETAYIQVSHALLGSAGAASVRLRIRFGSDATGTNEGAAFDDVEIVTQDLPCQGTEGAVGDDLTQVVTVNGMAAGTGAVNLILPGDIVTVSTQSPLGTLSFQFFLAGIEFFTPGVPPQPILANICFSATAATSIVVGDPNPVALPVTGFSYSFTYPGGANNVSMLCQSIVISPLADNNIYASTDGDELRFQ